MNLVESARQLFDQKPAPEVFLDKLADEIVRYHGETANANVKPPRQSPNPEKELGITTLYFDLMNFYSKWSIKIEDWRDLQPPFIELLKEYLAGEELNPRKLPGYQPLLTACGKRNYELAQSRRYATEGWFEMGQ